MKARLDNKDINLEMPDTAPVLLKEIYKSCTDPYPQNRPSFKNISNLISNNNNLI